MVFQFLWQVLLRGSMHSQISIWLHHNKGFLPQINFTQLTFSSSNLTPIVLTLTQILIRSVIYCLIEIFMYTPLEHYPIMCPAIFWVDTLPHSMWEESCFWSMTHNPMACALVYVRSFNPLLSPPRSLHPLVQCSCLMERASETISMLSHRENLQTAAFSIRSG